jgi:hypothetical protein
MASCKEVSTQVAFREIIEEVCTQALYFSRCISTQVPCTENGYTSPFWKEARTEVSRREDEY